MLKSNLQYDSFEMGLLKKWLLGHEGGALIKRLVSCERDIRVLFTPKDVARIFKAEYNPPSHTETGGTLVLSFPGSRVVSNKFHCLWIVHPRVFSYRSQNRPTHGWRSSEEDSSLSKHEVQLENASLSFNIWP